MKIALLSLRWPDRPAQGFNFVDPEEAVEFVIGICEAFGFTLDEHSRALLLKGEGDTATLSDNLVAEVTMVEATPEQEAQDADPLIKYVLMREDVPQPLVGRHAAQSNHAGTAFVMRAYRKDDAVLMAEINEWAKEGDGFGTTIVKTVTYAEMKQAVSLATLMGLYADIVHDPEYFVKDGDKTHFIPVDTCAFVFGRHSACNAMLRRFPLLKGPGE
jgi:peptidyl-tRNA hydrolase